MMGLAWLVAAGLLFLAGRRSDGQSGRQNLDLTTVAALAFFLLALGSTAIDLPLAKFTLEGFRFPQPSSAGDLSKSRPILSLGSDTVDDDRPITTLEVPGIYPEDGLIDVLARQTTGGWDVELRPRVVERAAPDQAPQRETKGFPLIGIPDKDRAFTQSNIHRLRGDETIVICPGGQPRPQVKSEDGASREDHSAFLEGPGEAGCFETPLPLKLTEDHVEIGPCNLNYEAFGELSDTSLSLGEVRERAVALLDLYHYDDACRPYRIDEGTAFWPRRDGAGGHVDVLRSFFILREEGVWLVRRDPESILKVEGLDNDPKLKISEVDAFDIEIIDPVLQPVFDSIELESLTPATEREAARGCEVDSNAPEPAGQVCREGYAGEDGTESYSGKRLCKRVPVTYSPRTSRTVHVRLGDAPMVFPPGNAPSVTLRPVGCSDPPCGVSDVRATYLSGSDVRVDVDDPTLSFPVTLAQGEPLVASIKFSEDPERCEEDPGPPCAVVTTRNGTWVFGTNQVLPLGDRQGERHLLRIVLFWTPWWLVAIIVGMFLLQSVLLPVEEKGPFLVVVSFIQVLLAARALYGFKVMAGFPHDAEGVVSAVLGAAVIPVALRITARSFTAKAVGEATVCLFVCALPIAGVFWKGTLPLQFDVETISVFGGLAACLGLSLVVASSSLWGAQLAKQLMGDLGPIAERFFGGVLLAAVALRIALATLGRERMFGIPVILWYYSLILIFGAGYLLATRKHRLLKGTVLVFAASILQGVISGGDKGAAMVLLPALAAALLFSWWSEIKTLSRRVGIGILVGLAALGSVSAGGLVLVRQDVDQNVLAKVGERPDDWGPSPTGYHCPVRTNAVESGTFDFEGPAQAFGWSNVWIRFWEYLVPQAANRVGTRMGSQVYESMEVMRRYSAGSRSQPFGNGYLETTIRRYGQSEVDAQLFDGVPSVLVASESGTGGLVGLLLLGLALLWSVTTFLEDEVPPEHKLEDAQIPVRRVLAFVALAAILIPIWTTFLMVGGNVGVLPFTGQSTPMLSVRSGADLILTPFLLIIGLAAIRGLNHLEALDDA